ncbi:hypothetical protein C4544_06280 [candidate division WS5 bacterium]|uniref:Transposase IS200-like domain-containing protein n=1 Tax=candidate division WS5 bacterium TaxID=2093353 RepID=A0A419DA49_9BACT|nr:MAG: hypothetical protein C4544_06280 [candidate division WS5 bacterium]
MVLMPCKNSVKKFIPGGVYHIYNRGVEKRSIFVDDHDYRTFLNLFKLTLTPKEELENADYIRIKNKSDSVELWAYCLMPNHFHLLIKQLDEVSMTEFMRGISNSYVSYFNKKYKRVGSLFQGIYKAAIVDKDEHLVHLSRYIHMNPLDIDIKILEYPYSSYKHYTGNTDPRWLNTSEILGHFNDQPKEYKKFVEDYKVDSLKIIKELSLD